MVAQYVFLTSSSYSGSTLLAFLLGSHSRIATVGEARGIIRKIPHRKYDCSCGQKYLTCPFWQEVERRMQAHMGPAFRLQTLQTKFIPRSAHPVDRLFLQDLRLTAVERLRDSLYNRSTRHRSYVENIVAHCVGLAEAVTGISGKDIFFDTSKTPCAIVHLNGRLDSVFKVIFLMRDGRGVFNSFLKKKIRLSEKAIMKRWVKTNRQIERSLQRIPPGNVFTVLYEDLCREPEETLTRICDFLGVDYEARCLRFWNYEHHIVGNNMRLNVKKKIQQDESWRRALSPDQLACFNRVAGKYNRRWGYC